MADDSKHQRFLNQVEQQREDLFKSIDESLPGKNELDQIAHNVFGDSKEKPEPKKTDKRFTGTITDYQGESPFGEDWQSKDGFWEKAKYDEGVSFFGPWEDPFSGFPEHTKRLARAIDSAGLPVHLRSIDPTNQWQVGFEVAGTEKIKLKEDYRDLLDKTISRSLVEIHHVVLTDEYLHQLVVHRFLSPDEIAKVNKHRIVSTVWERDRISDAAVRCLNQMGQLWVANNKDKRMLSRCGVDESKIIVIPIPFFPDDPLLKLNGRKRLPGPVRFYHIGKWEPRKAHHELIGTFMRAFEPGEAKLYFKTSSGAPRFDPPTWESGPLKPWPEGPYPNCPEVSYQWWLTDEKVRNNGWDHTNIGQNIYIMRQRLPQEGITRLHRFGDVYISLSRGEGFDMPAFDSKLAGNLLVYTPSGGPDDYAGEDDELVEPTGLIDCHPWYKWHECKYLDWDINHAALALRNAKAKIEQGIRTRGKDLTGFTADVVGRLAVDCINEVLGR